MRYERGSLQESVFLGKLGRRMQQRGSAEIRM